MAQGKAPQSVFDLECPCCQATLRIDPETRAVLTHKAKEKPPPIEDLGVAVTLLRGEAARREERFQKSVAEQKTHQQVLDKKFDELLRQAKSGPDITAPLKDIDLD